MAVLEVEDLHVRYGEVEAVGGVSFSVDDGEVFGLLGPNGAGKTSILEVCEGYRAANDGRVRVLGREPTDRALRQSVGVVLQAIAVTASPWSWGLPRSARSASWCRRWCPMPTRHRPLSTPSSSRCSSCPGRSSPSIRIRSSPTSPISSRSGTLTRPSSAPSIHGSAWSSARLRLERRRRRGALGHRCDPHRRAAFSLGTTTLDAYVASGFTSGRRRPAVRRAGPSVPLWRR